MMRRTWITPPRRSMRTLAAVLLTGFALLWGLAPTASAQYPSTANAVCAEVKIEIEQELTLERQAFDAHMRINNGLTNASLEDISVEVMFEDEQGNDVLASSNPDSTDALFFIRLDTTSNVSNLVKQGMLEFTGSVAPSTSADIHWMIIPAPGAADQNPEGTLYYVGATLHYTLSGEAETISVNPDYIYVKPMPKLTLDYFLPHDVHGDDAFTAEVEPVEPFSLGVRVQNSGFGTASQLSIESAQPKIVENEQGLLVGFHIEGSEVNGEEATDSLLVNFGDIAPNSSAVARWIMTCTLSGKFTEFDAAFTHADELGGKLTSLIDEINTHFLLHEVLVDVPGRDQILDFLATPGNDPEEQTYIVYESDNVETEVVDVSAVSNLVSLGGDMYSITTEARPGSLVYMRFYDPTAGSMYLTDLTRSDGSPIPPENYWISKHRNNDLQWEYFLNVFDEHVTMTADDDPTYTTFEAESGSTPRDWGDQPFRILPVQAEEEFVPDGKLRYTMVFEEFPDDPLPPEFTPELTNQSVLEGELLELPVSATDPNGTVPTLSAGMLPFGAEFQDLGDGQGIFRWTPDPGQSGRYYVGFSASDDDLSETQWIAIAVWEDTPVTISGYVWAEGGFGVADVELAGVPGFAVTDVLGHYAVDVAPGWSGTISPLKNDYVFTPEARTYEAITSDVNEQDYTANFASAVPTPVVTPTPQPGSTPTPDTNVPVPEPGMLVLFGLGLLGLWGLRRWRRGK